jgi:hypothetical protein
MLELRLKGIAFVHHLDTVPWTIPRASRRLLAAKPRSQRLEAPLFMQEVPQEIKGLPIDLPFLR